MFGTSSRKKRNGRAAASRCLEISEKVWLYRRDLLKEAESRELLRQTGKLRELLKSRADAGQLAAASESLEALARRMGGSIYPTSALAENVEFILVVAIVILGFRTFFVQNFKIPTNSMWPTYNGMTPQVFQRPADEPGALRETARILTVGAWPHRLDSPVDGEVLIPVGGNGSLGYIHSVPVAGHSWLVLPAKMRECMLLVDDQPVKVQLPVDFDFDWAVYDGFFGNGANYSHAQLLAAIQAKISAGDYVDQVVDGERLRCIRTGRHVKAGERVFAFDELSGDMVAVDRISYNFVRPRVGSGFVFRTGQIPGIAETYGDMFYIKRLVGVPGDTLEVKGTTLYRDGAPIEGSAAFDANARRLGKYPGYVASGLLTPGSTVHVEPGNYFAMGDNSPNSADGRVWGFVPEKEVMGRPLFTYYPVARWGFAR
ncbi:MAG TPA: signal peptidase I [Opitutaceae bacterium]